MNTPQKILIFWAYALSVLSAILILKDDVTTGMIHLSVNSVFAGDSAIWSFYARYFLAYFFVVFVLALPVTICARRIKKAS